MSKPIDAVEYAQCPTCSREYTVRCRCPLGDMRCANGHHWYHCPECGKRIVGESDHSLSTDYHKCGDCRGK